MISIMCSPIEFPSKSLKLFRFVLLYNLSFKSKKGQGFVLMKSQLESRYSCSLKCNLNQPILWKIEIFIDPQSLFLVSCRRSKNTRMGLMRLLLLLFITFHFQESNCCKNYLSRIHRSNIGQRGSKQRRSGRTVGEQGRRQCQIRVRFESRGMQFFKVLKKWF